MKTSHDPMPDMHPGTPVWYVWTIRLLPAGILVQFLSAGLGLFQDPDLLNLHGGVGMGLSVLPVALLIGALAIRRLRGFGWWAGSVLVLYVVQIALAAGANPLPLALHPANGALLLTASLVLLAKVERRRSRDMDQCPDPSVKLGNVDEMRERAQPAGSGIVRPPCEEPWDVRRSRYAMQSRA